MGNTFTKPARDDIFGLHVSSRRHSALSPVHSKKKKDARAHRKVSPRHLIQGNDDDSCDEDDGDSTHPRRSSHIEWHAKSETADRTGPRKKKGHVRRDSAHEESLVSGKGGITKGGQARQSRKAERRKHSDRERRFISRELHELDGAFPRAAFSLPHAGPHDLLTGYLDDRRKRASRFERVKRGWKGSASYDYNSDHDEHEDPSSGGSVDETSQLRQKSSLIHRPRTPQPPSSTAPTQECTICASVLPLSRFPKHPATNACTHAPTTCRRCLRKWLHTSFQTKVWDQLTCPECGAQLQHADVQRCAGKRVFEKYDGLAMKAVLEGMEGFQWCLVKDAGRTRGKKVKEKVKGKGKVKGGEMKKVVGGGCGSGQIHGLASKMQCMGCGTVQCVKHAILWHKGETCAEYDYRTDSKLKQAEEEASKKWIQQLTKKCPGCDRNIEKSMGCDHMTCSRCKHEFCWLCLAPYDPIRKQGNHMHRSNCPYHRVLTSSRR